MGQAPTRIFFFLGGGGGVLCFFVLFFVVVHVPKKKKLDRGLGRWSLANASFSQFFLFFSLDKTPKLSWLSSTQINFVNFTKIDLEYVWNGSLNCIACHTSETARTL